MVAFRAVPKPLTAADQSKLILWAKEQAPVQALIAPAFIKSMVAFRAVPKPLTAADQSKLILWAKEQAPVQALIAPVFIKNMAVFRAVPSFFIGIIITFKRANKGFEINNHAFLSFIIVPITPINPAKPPTKTPIDWAMPVSKRFSVSSIFIPKNPSNSISFLIG